MYICRFYISRETEEEVFARAKRVFDGRKDCQILGTADYVFTISYIEKQLLFLVKFGETIAEWHK
jgi:hypothetical protein